MQTMGNRARAQDTHTITCSPTRRVKSSGYPPTATDMHTSCSCMTPPPHTHTPHWTHTSHARPPRVLQQPPPSRLPPCYPGPVPWLLCPAAAREERGGRAAHDGRLRGGAQVGAAGGRVGGEGRGGWVCVPFSAARAYGYVSWERSVSLFAPGLHLPSCGL